VFLLDQSEPAPLSKQSLSRLRPLLIASLGYSYHILHHELPRTPTLPLVASFGENVHPNESRPCFCAESHPI